MFGSFFSIIIFLASCVNYEKHALRVSRVIAVLAKSACKHAIFLATRVKKIELTQVSLVNSVVDLFSLFFCCTEHITNFVIRKVTIFTFFMVTILYFLLKRILCDYIIN